MAARWTANWATLSSFPYAMLPKCDWVTGDLDADQWLSKEASLERTVKRDKARMTKATRMDGVLREDRTCLSFIHWTVQVLIITALFRECVQKSLTASQSVHRLSRPSEQVLAAIPFLFWMATRAAIRSSSSNSYALYTFMFVSITSAT